jgi:hypothetical protein
MPVICRVRENRLYPIRRQSEIGGDIGFIDTRLPVFYDVVGRHTCAPQHGTTALHTRPDFDKGTFRPIHSRSKSLFRLYPGRSCSSLFVVH